MSGPIITRQLTALYARLSAYYGPLKWWPAESPWEIMVGAILTQNTAWTNVDKALTNLKRANRLEPARLRALPMARLATLIRPAGFTSSKPKRLKILAKFLLNEYGDDPANMRGRELKEQRAQLLALHGIGPETADDILLYVAHQPIFVIDAYTRRILGRLGYASPTASYETLQALFMDNLTASVPLFNEYHALLDTHAKRICAKRAPRCPICPLNDICPKIGVEVEGVVREVRRGFFMGAGD